jgi:hypothetical protein
VQNQLRVSQLAPDDRRNMTVDKILSLPVLGYQPQMSQSNMPHPFDGVINKQIVPQLDRLEKERIHETALSRGFFSSMMRR